MDVKMMSRDVLIQGVILGLAILNAAHADFSGWTGECCTFQSAALIKSHLAVALLRSPVLGGTRCLFVFPT